MTLKEKAQAYDRALEMARKRVAVEPQDHTDEILKDIFPELKESEDERIRKDIIAFIKFTLEDGSAISPGSHTTKEEALAYLEKQKSVNPFSGTGFDYDGHHYGMCARDNGVEVTKDGKIIYRSVPPFIEQNSTTEETLRKKVDVCMGALSEIAFALYKSECRDNNPVEQIRTIVTDTAVEIMEINEERKEQKPDIIEKLREISTPADEDWFEIEKKWLAEDYEDVRLLVSEEFVNNAKVIDGQRFAVLSWERFKNIALEIVNRGKEIQKDQKPVNWTELNGEDIAKLEVLINNVHNEYPNGIGQESFGREVLERFREYKEDKDLDEKEQKPTNSTRNE